MVDRKVRALKHQYRRKLVLDQQRHSCTWDGKEVQLTVTEFLILFALSQRPGIVKSRDNLMDAAYDDQVYVDDRTIDSHIKRLRSLFWLHTNRTFLLTPPASPGSAPRSRRVRQIREKVR